MLIELDKRFAKKVQGMFGKYEFEVGVLADGPHYLPKKGEPGLKGQEILKTYAGGPARMQSRTQSGLSISQVSQNLRKTLGFNYLTQPFQSKSSAQADILKFSNEFFRLVFGRSQKKRAENLLQAIVRNPMLRGDYGSNAPLTQIIKGFDRKTIDTGQLFKAIIARCTVKGRAV